MERHVMSVLVENNPITFNRVLGMLSRKGYCIEHFVIEATGDLELFCITFAVSSGNWSRNQLKDQLAKLLDVLKIDVVRKSSLDNGILFAAAK